MQARINLRTKKRKSLPKRIKQPIVTPALENVCWSMDFMSDGLRCGRTVRLLNILDDFNREPLVMEADSSMPSQRVFEDLKSTALMLRHSAENRSGQFLNSAPMHSRIVVRTKELKFAIHNQVTNAECFG